MDNVRYSPLEISNFISWVIFCLVCLLCAVAVGLVEYAIFKVPSADFKFSEFISCMAFSVPLSMVLIGMLLSNIQYHANFKQRETEREKEYDQKLIEREINRIGDSINLFYLPLYNLLTTYDENVSLQSRNIEMANINGHKHLAESRVRCVFEKYLQNSNESQKLLELVSRDIELFQLRFIELDLRLKDH